MSVKEWERGRGREGERERGREGEREREREREREYSKKGVRIEGIDKNEERWMDDRWTL